MEENSAPLISFSGADILGGEDNIVVYGLDLQVYPGQVVYIIGKVGSGKTSIFRTITAENPLPKGSGEVCGFNLRRLRAKEVPHLRRKIGVVFQDFQLLMDRSVEDNLAFVLKATGWKDASAIHKRIGEVLEAVDMTTKAHKMPHQLSGGEQQRIAIARAILNNPAVILADEPTGNLDDETAEGILQLLLRQQAGLRMLMEFVCSFGLRPVLALRAYKYHGDEALESLRENPYLLCSSIIGGSFREADEMARGLGVGGNSKNRISAAVLFELAHNTGNGHCFIPREKLADVTVELIGVEREEADECIGELIEDRRLIYEEIAGVRACYLPELYEAETNTAEILARMSKRRFPERMDTEKFLQKLETRQNITYAPDQRETLKLALTNQLMVLTGGPGTGKTTCIRAILAMFDALGLKTLLCAPTGRAAKRMTEVTGREAATVHRLLGAKFDEEGDRVVFTKKESDRLDCEAVILDECSMVDLLLMDSLLRALPPDARLILVGDADQLPSVGPGNVFSALIRSEVVATVRLSHIHRQAEGSRIVRNAHMIKNGECPDFAENAGDFFRLKRLQAASAVETITELCAVRLPGKMHIPPEDIQVLSPTRKGETGTVNLNRALQAALNPPAPGKKEKPFGDAIFREGDRVMQIRNNYDILWKNANNSEAGIGIYNGDMGILRAIDPEAETLTLDFDGRIATYGFDALTELEHAWAVTVHKAQGSEYRAVILSLNGGSQLLMTRSVLYTAVTRAKQLLILVGDDAAAKRMVENVRQARRYTVLRVRLRQLCGL